MKIKLGTLEKNQNLGGVNLLPVFLTKAVRNLGVRVTLFFSMNDAGSRGTLVKPAAGGTSP